MGDKRILVERLSDDEIKRRGISSWPIWSKGVSRFEWFYDQTETCYILDGRVIIETEDNEKVEIKKGDFVTFPVGLSCVWNIKEPIRKHYSFKL